MVISEQGVIGWGSLIRGHISKRWREVYKLSRRSVRESMRDDSLTWLRGVIIALWTYSKELWSQRNRVVHGNQESAQESKGFQTVCKEVIDLFQKYDRDNYMILHISRHLFTRAREEILAMSSDGIVCWLHSLPERL
jgi:hypothetical protein